MDIAWSAVTAAAILFTLGATSPGPSLMIVIRNTLVGGRSRGVACAIGHGLGFGIYCALAVFGLVLLIESVPSLFDFTQFLASLLLVWMGQALIRSDPELKDVNFTKFKGFTEGFLFAFLNPKIAIFMLAVLSSVLEPGMSIETKIILGMLGLTIDITWYLIVAIALSSQLMMEKMQRKRQLMNQITGVLMLLMAIWVWLRLSNII